MKVNNNVVIGLGLKNLYNFGISTALFYVVNLYNRLQSGA